MKIILDNGDYQLELNAERIMGEDKDKVKDLAGTVLCHLLLVMLTRYAENEGEAKDMMVDILEDMVDTLEAFFDQGAFDEFHRLQVEEDDIDVEDLKNRYKSCEQLNLIIGKDNMEQ